VLDFFYYKVYNCACPDWIRYPIGNIQNKTIAEIWNNNTARHIRRKMYDGEWQDICNPICPHIIAYRRENKFIKYSELENFDFLTPGLIEEIRAGKDCLDSPPTLFKLDNSRVCNISCIMCTGEEYKDKSGLLKKTIDDITNYLPTSRRVILSGLGEPMARPDTRDLLINYKSENPSFKFDLITNALLIPKYWEQIKHQNFGTLLISIDAATKETYEEIRKGGSWETLLQSLSLIKENRNKFSSVTLNMTVMKLNYNEIPAFIDLAESYGFNVSFQKIRGTFGDQNIFERRDGIALFMLRRIIRDELLKERGIDIFWGELVEFIEDAVVKR
jgi:MoaA/NifB/PqqE/SkfB family radical SAM enzyme